MDEAREPLLMIAVAVAVAVYKALLHVQANEARVRAESVAVKSENERLRAVAKRQAERIGELEEIITGKGYELKEAVKSIWDNDDHPW